MQIGKKGVKLSLLLYIENSKDTTRKLLELISESGKVAGYKINIQKSVAFLHTNDELSVNENKETIPLYNPIRKNKTSRNKSKDYTEKTTDTDERN